MSRQSSCAHRVNPAAAQNYKVVIIIKLTKKLLFLNVIRVQNTLTASIVHLCPALMLNLLETAWLSARLVDPLRRCVGDRYPS